MQDFLRKLKLVDDLEMELKTDSMTFLRAWEEHVDHGSTNFLSNPFEAFSSSKNEFVGQIDSEGFKIRKRKKLFDRSLNAAVVEGSYIEANETLFIKAKIVGFHPIMFVFLGFIALVYLIFGLTFTLDESAPILFILPFLLFHSCLMLGIPYFILRRSVKRMKRELQREFYFMIKS